MNTKRVQLEQKPRFRRVYKKLSVQQRVEVDDGIRALMADPDLGEAKVGDLKGIRVYKFRVKRQPTLLAYTFDDRILTLMALGPHENFYRGLR